MPSFLLTARSKQQKGGQNEGRRKGGRIHVQNTSISKNALVRDTTVKPPIIPADRE